MPRATPTLSEFLTPRQGSLTTYVEDKTGVDGQPEHICQLDEAGRGWPGLEAALSLIWRWWGVLEGELAGASRRLSST